MRRYFGSLTKCMGIKVYMHQPSLTSNWFSYSTRGFYPFIYKFLRHSLDDGSNVAIVVYCHSFSSLLPAYPILFYCVLFYRTVRNLTQCPAVLRPRIWIPPTAFTIRFKVRWTKEVHCLTNEQRLGSQSSFAYQLDFLVVWQRISCHGRDSTWLKYIPSCLLFLVCCPFKWGFPHFSIATTGYCVLPGMSRYA